ncbi:unnamed protein product [Ambrosiozyma monospora]|uniref:Unnamed protein product n=1 Tax=Ambrosiozyma monospora TaxID=43982 RepID=A0ACB5U8P6_AMBMO|nr:unnamed protein product [Ambrosiozyma monospora]
MSTPAKTTEDKKAFIVTLKEDVAEPAVAKFKSTIASLGGEITTEYNLIKGFVVKLPSIHATSLSKDENVVSVEEDKSVSIKK